MSPTPKTYEVHPIANIFPLLDENSPTFKAFVEDIEKRGQREPIWIFEGKILDGRNRQHLPLARRAWVRCAS